MPWHFPQIARTWQPEDSTVKSGCIVRTTARWKRASCQYRCSEVRNEVGDVVAGGGLHCLGVDCLSVEPLGPSGDHRISAARSAGRQAPHTYARRQETPWKVRESLDDVGLL